MSDLKKAAAKLLNKLIHDEYQDCANLISTLQIILDSGDAETMKVFEEMAVVVSALEARKTIYQHISADFYKLRSALEA